MSRSAARRRPSCTRAPSELPDLFAGSQLLIAGRYTGSGPVTARLTGTVGGKPVSYALATTLPAVADTNDFLPRLWATRKIGTCWTPSACARPTDGGQDDPELVSEIVRLSKEYGVVTPYTSFLVTDGSEELRDRPTFGARAGFSGGGFGGGGGGGGGGRREGLPRRLLPRNLPSTGCSRCPAGPMPRRRARR